VFPNAEEAATLTGERSPEAMAARLAELYPGALVALKLDADGAYVLPAGEAGVAIPPNVNRLVDATGAGDAFAGAFLSRWLRGATPVAAARFAVGVSEWVIQQSMLRSRRTSWFVVLALVLVVAACTAPPASPDPIDPAVTSVTVLGGDRQVRIHRTVTLEAAVVAVGGADTSVVWSSSDPAVAEVSAGGVVTPLEVGLVTITATSAFDEDVSDDVEVEVLDSHAVSDWTALNDALFGGERDIEHIHLLDDIVVPAGGASPGERFGRLLIDRTVTIDGVGRTLSFAHGELIVGSRDDDSIVVRLEDVVLQVHNPTWRTPASAYGILVLRGTFVGVGITVDLQWTDAATDFGVGGAAPAGVTTHYGALTQTDWTVDATLIDSTVRVYSESLNPYGFYASAGSTVTLHGNTFEICRSDTTLLVQGIALGAQDELPAEFNDRDKLYPTLDVVGNVGTGCTSHGVMVYRADGDLDDGGTSAQALILSILAGNPGLPQVGLLLPGPEEIEP
jgi:hypothetical protein